MTTQITVESLICKKSVAKILDVSISKLDCMIADSNMNFPKAALRQNKIIRWNTKDILDWKKENSESDESNQTIDNIQGQDTSTNYIYIINRKEYLTRQGIAKYFNISEL